MSEDCKQKLAYLKQLCENGPHILEESPMFAIGIHNNYLYLYKRTENGNPFPVNVEIEKENLIHTIYKYK